MNEKLNLVEILKDCPKGDKVIFNCIWRPSTEHPLVDEEVIALVGENKMISFAHIVDKDRCFDYDGWNIPDVKCWIPCPKIEED